MRLDKSGSNRLDACRESSIVTAQDSESTSSQLSALLKILGEEMKIELELREPVVHWRAHASGKQQQSGAACAHPHDVACSVTLQEYGGETTTTTTTKAGEEVHEMRHALPFRLHLQVPRRGVPLSASEKSPNEWKDDREFLEQQVLFQVVAGDGEDKVVSAHTFTLRECIPVLPEGSITWTDVVTWREVRWCMVENVAYCSVKAIVTELG